MLGKLWPLLNQLAQIVIYTYVFSIVLQVRSGINGFEDSSPFLFGLWLFAGLLPWTTFSGGLAWATSSVVSQPNLVKKVVFPLTLLPLVPVIAIFIESTLGIIVLIIFIALFTQSVHSTFLLLPLIWLPQLCLTAGLGFLLASLTVFVQDVKQLVDVALRLWFYVTPVIYPANLIPQQYQKLVLWLNPMAPIVEMYRDVLISGEVIHWMEWTISTGISVVILCCGLWIYGKLRPSFADVI